MTRITFDIGFGSIKVATLTDGILNFSKEQNAVCDLGTENFDAYNGKEKDIVAFNGHHYIVGKSALQKNDATIQKISDYETIKLVTPIIATKYLNNFNKDDVEYICFTLSSAYLSYSKDFHRYLSDMLPDYKGKIKLVPQGSSCKKAINNVGFDVDNPSYKDSLKNYLLFDVGFNTLDVACVVNDALLPSDVTGYEHTGAILIAEEVQKQIKTKFDIDLPMSRVKPILEDKSFKIRSDIYDCADIVQKAIELYLDVLKDFLEKNYAEEMNAISNIVMMGGGAEIIRENISIWDDYYGKGFVILPKVPGSATFYNSIGGLYLNVEKK